MQFSLLLSVLPLTLALAVPPVPLESPAPELPAPNTIIDFLSASVEYLYFLRHIQRLGLVPQINRMANVTLFAPINLAFVDSELAASDTAETVLRYFASEKFLVKKANNMITVLDSMYVVKEFDEDSYNVEFMRQSHEEVYDQDLDTDGAEGGMHESTKEEEEEDDFFDAISESFDVNGRISDTNELTFEEKGEKPKANVKKYFPLLIAHQTSPKDGKNLRINDVAEIIEADNYVKHQMAFIHGIDSLLPSSPSICDVLMNNSTNTFKGHSISFIGEVFQLLFNPKHITALKKPVDDQFPKTCEQFLANVSTIFLPTDAYINASLLETERKYYVAISHGLNNPELYPTKAAVHEMRLDAFELILGLFLVDEVLQDTLRSSTRYSSLNSQISYKITGNITSGQIKINGKLESSLGLTSLAVSDGLVHVFHISSDEQRKNPPDFFSALGIERVPMIPRKALYAYHFSHLVSEIEFRKLGKYIGAKAKKQTILIDMSDRDDNKEEEDEMEAQNSISISSFTNRQQLLYRFIDSYLDMGAELSKEKPVFHEMLDSKLCLKKRIGSCYKVKVWGELTEDGLSVSFNDDFETGLPVLAANENAIYFSNNDYEAPVSFKRVMAELISDGLIPRHHETFLLNKDACLETLKYLDSYDLILLDDNRHGYTAFLPCGEAPEDSGEAGVRENAWAQLGLVLRYLQGHPKEFKKILKGMFLQDMIYTHPDKNYLDRVIDSMAGNPVHVTQKIHADKQLTTIQLNDTELLLALNSDVLFNQGVIHITEELLLPTDFRLSLRELVETTEEAEFPETSFFRLLEKFPAVQSKLDLDLANPGYSLFVPTPDLLHWKNITANYRRLDQLLQMHMIPNSQLQPLLDCVTDLPQHVRNANYTFQTNHTKAIFRCQINPATGKAYLTLQKPQGSSSYDLSAKTQRVTILSRGCTQGIKNGSCVFLIENPISPSWFDVPDNFLYVHIGWISVGIGIIIGVILFGFCTTTLVLCLSTTGTKRKSVTSGNGSQSSLFAATESSYMRITSDEDMEPNNYDYGYETDTDMMGEEEEGLLPKKPRKKRKGTYGSFSPMGTPSAPLMIDRENLKKAFSRDRNLPGLKI